MDSFNIRSVVRGFHIYKDVWSPSINEELPTQQEHGNPADPHAVAIMKTGAVVGHVPREISTFCWYFLIRNGTISCTVTGRRQCSFLPEGGLEIPCLYKFKGKAKHIGKMKSMFCEMNYETLTD